MDAVNTVGLLEQEDTGPEGEIEADGVGFTVTVDVAEAVVPQLSVAVTVYTVVT